MSTDTPRPTSWAPDAPARDTTPSARKLLHRVALELDVLRACGHLTGACDETAIVTAERAAEWAQRPDLDAAHAAVVRVGVEAIREDTQDAFAQQRLAGCRRRCQQAAASLGGER